MTVSNHTHFEARYGGTCDVCTERIHPGQLACFLDGFLIHEACTTDVRIPIRRMVDEVCPNCFLIKPCPCDDGANR